MIAITYAQVAELVDAHVSGACVEVRQVRVLFWAQKGMQWSMKCLKYVGEMAELVETLL